jgi:hypothetical protein
MHRKRWLSLLTVVLAMTVLWLLQASMSRAAPVVQPDQADGQDYVVQRGDSLYRISGQFYGNPARWPEIVDATNAKAAEDSSYSMITNPSRLRVGQKLWIPTLPEAQTPARMSEAATSTPVVTPTATRQPAATAATTVRFVEPAAGTVVSPSFGVVLTATGLVIEPAGAIREGAGHLHVLIDTDFVPPGDVVVNDEQHIHLGQGQVTTTLQLEPGEHILRLQFTNGAHIALDGEEYRDTITVTVAADADGPSVRFVEPVDGAVVPPEVDVVLAATGLIIEPAGVIREGAGHLHILIDTDFVPAGDVVVNDEQHIHLGQGQVTTTLQLEPGEHILRVQFTNGAHIALAGEDYRDTITVTVRP